MAGLGHAVRQPRTGPRRLGRGARSHRRELLSHVPVGSRQRPPAGMARARPAPAAAGIAAARHSASLRPAVDRRRDQPRRQRPCRVAGRRRQRSHASARQRYRHPGRLPLSRHRPPRLERHRPVAPQRPLRRVDLRWPLRAPPSPRLCQDPASPAEIIAGAAGPGSSLRQHLRHAAPHRLLPPALELRVPATATSAVATRPQLSGRLYRRADVLRRRSLARTQLAGPRHRGAAAAHAGRRAGLPRRPALGARADDRQLARKRRHRRHHGVVLHADGVAAPQRPGAARRHLRLHGRAFGVSQRAAADAPARDGVAEARRPRPDRRPEPVRSQAPPARPRDVPAERRRRSPLRAGQRPRARRTRAPCRRAAGERGGAAARLLRRHRRAARHRARRRPGRRRPDLADRDGRSGREDRSGAAAPAPQSALARPAAVRAVAATGRELVGLPDAVRAQ